ncbi:hypothetical protein PGIGA_G00065070 [Pangasianodon gigas]|uniref:Uncharacterized protein n=1 Tax=Pangasianodon gigas TaxID=30993 RepID=A0ACC5X5N0_PANGG|nr:hypothetical protein [Pangasianodon gigas]
MEAGLQKVLQVDLEVNGLVDPLGTRSVMWQVEYPMSRTFSEEIPTLIRLAPHDLGGIVPLAMVKPGEKAERPSSGSLHDLFMSPLTGLNHSPCLSMMNSIRSGEPDKQWDECRRRRT